MKDQDEFSFDASSPDEDVKPAKEKPVEKDEVAEPEAEEVAAEVEKTVAADVKKKKTPLDMEQVDLGHGPLQKLVDSNFLQYASYVICDRAIPALEDGLKPVQRRILHALHDKDDGRFIKVANIVGHTMQYHPHGDASIADALVNLTNKTYLIEGQGNFGNIYTGDRAAASRYIECRLTELAREEIFNKDLTKYIPSYDGRNKEPVSLPAKIPLLLMLGAEGIAVGMSTKILPHNFIELLEAQIQIINKKPFKLFPDFQLGGLMDVTEYDRGIGKVKVRAVIDKRGDDKLVITELPHGVTTEALIGSIEDAVKSKKVPVKSITDFTSEAVEIELDMLPDTKADKAIKSLYAFTSCETSLSSRIVVIRNNRPVELNVDDVIKESTANLLKLLKRELNHRKKSLLDDFHGKTLVQIFIENRIYKRIEESKTAEAVQQAVMTGLEPFADRLNRPVTKSDIEMLLAVRIRRISLFDINKNKKDLEDILAELDKVEKNLKSLNRYAISYLNRLIKKYGAKYPRRTKMTVFKEIAVRELTAKEIELFYDKETGYLGSAVAGESVIHCSSYDKVIIVSDDGKYRLMPPPEKYYVGKILHYCSRFDRDKVMTVIYTDEMFTYMKRFAFGGTIMNRDYNCASRGGKIHVFSDSDVDDVYVKYSPAKAQRIHQQVFSPSQVPVKGVKARGNQMTGKKISRLSLSKPRGWGDGDGDPKGVLL